MRRVTAPPHAAVLIYLRAGGVAAVVVRRCECISEMLAESAALDEDAVALDERNN